MKEYVLEQSRRGFITRLSMLGVGLSLSSFGEVRETNMGEMKRIGIIGLDTGHSNLFARDINVGVLKDRGYRVVAAYPHGTKDIASALKMKPGIIEDIQSMGIELVDSIARLLDKVDFVLLESNDGRVHLEQAAQVIKAGKRMFIDKPMAENLKGVEAIFALAKAHRVPIFSSSALRFDNSVKKIKAGSVGQVYGADIYTYAELESSHIDMAWYMIHGLEMLYAIMGTGCEEVFRVHNAGFDKVVGIWSDGRIGSVRGIRRGHFTISGIVFGEKAIEPLGIFVGYQPLLSEILTFFDTGEVPVHPEETLEIFRFMEAAEISRDTGNIVKLNTIKHANI